MASRRGARIDGRDVLLLLGLGALVYGVAQWSGPGAWVLVGLLAVAAWLLPYVARMRKG